MDPITASVSALHATYQVLLFSVDVDQVPSQVRRSLELVQTCHRDLQHLIEIRNECLPLLEKTPIVLGRVNDIINTANQGLVEVCQIVEKCRPGANNGKVPFKNRVGWVLFDSREFRAQEPVISRHHAAVLSEMNFLRQIALLAPMSLQQAKPETGETNKPQKTEIFDNVALLGGLMGEMAISGKHPSAPSFPTEALDVKSTTHKPTDSSFYTRPSKDPTRVMAPALVKPTSAPHDTFFELEAPFDPSLRSSTPRANPPSQPVFRGPIPDQAPAKFEITAPPPSPDTGLGRLSLWHGNQTQETLVEPPPTSSTPSIVVSGKPSDLKPLQHLRSSPSIPSINSIDPSSNPSHLSEQPSDPNMIESSRKERYSRFSGYFRRAKEPRHETFPLGNAGTQNNLRHVKSHGDMSLARSGTQSTVTGKWFSPDSVYALASPTPSHATLDSEAPTLGPSHACTPFDSTVSLNTIFTVTSDATTNPDTDHEISRPGDTSMSTCVNVQPPTPVQSRPSSVAPLGAQHLRNVSTGTTNPVVFQPQNGSTSSTIIFESAFWGLGSSQDYMNFDIPHKSPRTHAQGELERSRTEGTLSTAPHELGTKQVRHASSHADLTYHKTTSATNSPQELSSVPSIRVAELP